MSYTKAPALADSQRQKMENDGVPARVIEQYEDKLVHEQNIVLFRHLLVFQLFCECYNYWIYVNISSGFGSIPVEVYLDWSHVDRLLRLRPAFRQLTIDQLSEIDWQLRIIERAALAEKQKNR